MFAEDSLAARCRRVIHANPRKRRRSRMAQIEVKVKLDLPADVELLGYERRVPVIESVPLLR